MIDAMLVEASPIGETLPLLRALADPTRLRILARLANGPRCACVLRSEVDVAANLLSHHLRVLRVAGVVEGTRRGRWVDYRMRPEALAGLRTALADLLPDRGPGRRPGHAAASGAA